VHIFLTTKCSSSNRENKLKIFISTIYGGHPYKILSKLHTSRGSIPWLKNVPGSPDVTYAEII